ncbi:hypothetical protein L873DRAFT_1834106 [Choiromyces venosus 120613-1]|uniref:Uncharacterized protein n=1 Tax=Choiromyces venosus 120613-1 TaxID=1336337 RepID=A0A3N4K025_9PEZI|nr:hypothetical protein L873DRAFT_1834106 [Choiromyces venosus 120613-1]
MAGVNSVITVESIDDITPGTIFVAYSTLPFFPKPNRRPFLALWRTGNQVVSLPLTSLRKGAFDPPTAAKSFGRSLASYFPIAPASNRSYLPITATPNITGFIDLLTPVTIGQSSLPLKKTKATIISARDLQNVIMAHVGLVQCGQEEILTGLEDQTSEILVIGRSTCYNIRQIALDMLQCSEQGLLHARRTQEITKSLVEAFDKPPTAKLILPRPHHPTPSPSSTFVDQPPPPPHPPRPPQADTQHRQPAQMSSGQQRQQSQQPRQILNNQSGPASCRPDSFPRNPRNPDNGGGGDGSSGARRSRGFSGFYTAPTGGGSNQQRNRATARMPETSGNQGVQHQEEYQHGGDDEIEEWTKSDWDLVEDVTPEEKVKERELGKDSDSISEWDLDDWDKLEDIIPGNMPKHQYSQYHTPDTLPAEMDESSTCESTYSISKGDRNDFNSEVPQGNTAIPHPLLSPLLQEGKQEPPSKDTSHEHDRRSNKSSPYRHKQHQRNFLPVSLTTQPQWAQSQFANLTHALRRITARPQLHREATPIPATGDIGEDNEDVEDTQYSDTDSQNVTTTPPITQATRTTTPEEEQTPSEQFKIVGPETTPITPVGTTGQQDAHGQCDALLEPSPRSAASEGGEEEEGEEEEEEGEENKKEVVEEEYYKVYKELQRILLNSLKSSIQVIGVSEDELNTLHPNGEVSFVAYRSFLTNTGWEEPSGQLLAALDRGQSLQQEMTSAEGRVSLGLLIRYVDVAREICLPYTHLTREIDELRARTEIALGSISSTTTTTAGSDG